MARSLMAEAREVRNDLARLRPRRDELIVAMYADGLSLAKVGGFWGLSRPRVHEILRAHQDATGTQVLRPAGRPRTTR